MFHQLNSADGMYICLCLYKFFYRFKSLLNSH